MKKILSLACAATIAATSIGMSTASASAVTFPQSVPVSEAAGADVIQVRRGGERRYHNRRGFYRQGQHRYYNGYRGYDHRRAGYRYHNGYWFPAAAFIFGAIIGGALANQPVHAAPGRLSQAHVNWCSSQYRSYRLSDNSFQPYNGPRRQCVSPFSR